MLQDKVVFITGGASGLGRILVEECLKAGAKVFFTYFSSGEKATALCQSYPNQVGICQADASEYNQVEHSVNECIKSFGRIDVLINNAATAKDGTLVNIDTESFDYTIRHVLNPVFHYSKAVCPYFINQMSGNIINIGSINGLRGREGSIAYSTAKAAIIGFTKTSAKELGEYGINCNVVAPGFINTDGQARTSEIIKKVVLSECAIRRLTEPEEVANMVLFLASEKAKNITGQVYKVDCGQYI